MCMLCWGKGGETAIASIYFTLFHRSHRPRTQSPRQRIFSKPDFFAKSLFVIRAALRCPPLSKASHPEVLTWKKKKKSKSFLNPGCEAGRAALNFAKVWKKISNLKKISHRAHPAVQDWILLSIVQSVLGPGTAAEETCIHPPFHVGFSERERPRNTSALDEINRLNDDFRLSHPCRSALPPFSPHRHFRPPNKINIERGDAITWYLQRSELWNSTFVGRKRNFKRWSGSEDTVVWSGDPSLYDLKTSAILSPWGQRRPKRQESGFYTAYHD